MDKEYIAEKYLDYLTKNLNDEDTDAEVTRLFQECPYYKYVHKEIDHLLNDLRSGQHLNREEINLSHLRKKLRAIILSHTLKQLINMVHFKLANQYNKLRYTISPPGKYISLIGPDGSGKTTTANTLINLFNKKLVLLEHHAPEVFYVYQGSSLHVLPSTKILGRIFEHLDSEDREAESKASGRRKQHISWSILSMLRKIKRVLIPDSLFKSLIAINYALDRVASYFFMVVPKIRRGDIVISDRTAFDLFNWFNINPDSLLAKILLIIIPKGDRIVILYNTAEIIWQRKPELPIDIIKRELNTFLHIDELVDNMIVVKTDESVDLIANKIIDRI